MRWPTSRRGPPRGRRVSWARPGPRGTGRPGWSSRHAARRSRSTRSAGGSFRRACSPAASPSSSKRERAVSRRERNSRAARSRGRPGTSPPAQMRRSSRHCIRWRPPGSRPARSSPRRRISNGTAGTRAESPRSSGARRHSPCRRFDPLGSWRATAVAQDVSAKVSLATIEGPLRLAGGGTLSLPGRLEFSGEARAEPGRERDLEPLLDLLGPRRADGARALEIR